MTNYAPQDFKRFHSELCEVMKQAAEQYAAKHLIDGMNQQGLTQMSQSMEDTAKEMLFFGFDTWPALESDDVVTLPKKPRSETVRSILGALAACVICTLSLRAGYHEETQHATYRMEHHTTYHRLRGS